MLPLAPDSTPNDTAQGLPASSGSVPLVVVQGLCKQFPGGATPALQGIDATVFAGRMTGLVGPDGAGKTTLLRHMVGLMHGSAGSVTVAGHDAATQAEAIHEITGYMPQKFGLYEDLTVVENLTLYADLRHVVGKERQERFKQLLHFTDLERFQQRLAGKLSGGMKQKLGLACALLGNPRLLLLDEPSVGVDPISRRELWAMVRELLAGGMGVVWSTAYLDEAEKCDTVILLNQGKKLYDGPPQGLLQSVAGRVFQARGVQEHARRRVLTHLLQQESVMDGVIQGRFVRVTLREGAPPPPLEQGEWVPAAPCFEDAFINALGGGPGGRSRLAESMQAKPATDQAVIEAQGLTKCFGSFVAVKDNTFSIARGEIFGLLGPNGAGKSTTFKMMCGLLQPTHGKAFVTGLDLKTATSAARSRIGYMAQKFSLYGQLNVLQNLKFFSGLYGLGGRQQKDRIELMVSIFDLHAYLGMNAGELPLGFKQRLALACSVMHHPDVLFLDEPTSGVDPITRREFWTHINGMVEKGVTVMVTTHFMDEAEYCDRIGLIYRGENIATGSPDDLKAMARTEAMPEPTLEDAFITLVERSDAAQGRAT